MKNERSIDEQILMTKAKRLAKQMGPGWVPEIWLNLGWHYCIKKLDGKVAIHPGLNGQYVCFFNGPKQFVTYGVTPRASFDKAFDQADKFVREYQSFLMEVK